jgi:CelD/BcsL family acetyltransferase involved in cellulose biosynthesis
VRILKKIPDDFWWEVARNCSYATFYHTPIWKELAERTYPGFYQDETFGAILPSGVRVVFPMISTRRRGPLRWLLSTFEGCYGGFIADGPVSPAEAAAIYDHACSLTTYTFHMLDNPIAPPIPDTVTAKLSAVVHETNYTLTLDGDFATIFSRFSRTRRNVYRGGIRKGVQTRLAASLDDYRAYFASYRDAIDRWGESESYGYSWSFFEHIYALSQIYPEHVTLWLMIVNGQIVGGKCVFYWNQQVATWSGTAHRDFLDYGVIPVGDTEIIRDAVARGFRYVDFSTCGGLQGMIDYKRRFGAVGIPINVWRFVNPLLKQMRQVYQQVAKRPLDASHA